MMRISRLIASLVACVFLFCLYSSSGYSQTRQGVPTIKDHWHFNCISRQISKSQVIKARNKAETLGDSTLSGGIAFLNYACYLHIYEIETFQKRLAKFNETGKGKQPVYSEKSSKAQLKRAKSAIQSAYKRNKRNPKGIYYYGYTLALTEDSLAVNIFDELQTKHKSSPYAIESYLALGEFYFDNQRFDNALSEYSHSVKSKKKSTKLYTKYKIAWAHYMAAKQTKNMGKQQKALAELASLLRKVPSSKGGKYKILHNIIKSDVLEILADMGSLANAKRILSRTGQLEVYATLLERMAMLKLQQGDLKTAHKLFTTILREQPNNPDRPRISSILVEIMAQNNNTAAVVKQLKTMVTSYISKKARWRSKQNKKTLAKTDKLVEDLIFSYATAMDQTGHQTKNTVLLNNAAHLYNYFLKVFPKSKRGYDIHYYYGQLLFDRKQYLYSARSYLSFLKKYPKGKYTKDAIATLITAAQTAVEADKKQYRLPKPGAAKKPIPLPTIKKTFADSLDVYIRYMPKDANVPTMKYMAATTYYDFGHYEEAIKRYLLLVTKHPDFDYTKESAIRVLYHEKTNGTEEGFEKAKEDIGKIAKLKSDPQIAPYFVETKKKKKKKKKVAKKKKKKKVAKKKPKKKKKKKEQDESNEDSEDSEDNSQNEQSEDSDSEDSED